MPKNTIADLDVTTGNNTDVLGQNSQGSADANQLDAVDRATLALLARFYADLGGVVTVGGSANAITVTSASTYQALESGLVIAFKASSANTTAATLNLDGLGAKAIRLSGDVALAGNEIKANGRYLIMYDAAYNAAAGAWVLMDAEPTGFSLTTTDNAALRADGTSGRAQNSAFIIDDTGNVSSFGGQVAFPATQNASADANTLDDYEEGTWTPAFSATGCTFSYSAQVGSYTKIGNRVTIDFSITLNTSGNTLAANALSITGFPFANGNGAAAAAQLFWSNATSSYVHMSGLINNGASTLSVSGLTAAFTSANLAATASGALHATNGSSIRGTISYKV